MNPTRASLCIPLIWALSFGVVSAKAPANLEEAKKCAVFVETFRASGEPYARGSGFILEENGTQWIYTNAHVIDGAAKIVIRDDVKAQVDGFGRFACFATGSGDIELDVKEEDVPLKVKFGGDGVRIELVKKREFAFVPDAPKPQVEKGRKVITLGDNDGDGTMEVLEGEVRNSTDKVALSSCKTRHGSSGGALIDAESFKVIGINTWGFDPKANPLNALWNAKRSISEDYAGATILGTAGWVELKPQEFLGAMKDAERIVKTICLLTIIYDCTPTKKGFSIAFNDPFAGTLTYREAFDRYKSDPILYPVCALNEKLNRSNIDVSSMEIVRTYAKALRDIRDAYQRERDVSLKKLPPYYRVKMEQMGFLALGDRCHEGLANAQEWFESKSKVGGGVPVGAWFNLPRLHQFPEQKKGK